MPTLPSDAVSQQWGLCCCATALNGNIHVASLIDLMLLRDVKSDIFFFFTFMYNCALFLSLFIIFNVGHVHENMVVLLGQDI